MTKTIARMPETMPTVFDNLFNRWSPWFGEDKLWSRAATVPAVNVTEKKDAFEVTLAAPGFEKKDFKIDLAGSILTISSEREDSIEEKEKKYTRMEYSYSSFNRSFTLPDEVVADKIEAKYENGELRIHLPRKHNGKIESTKQITIK